MRRGGRPGRRRSRQRQAAHGRQSERGQHDEQDQHVQPWPDEARAEQRRAAQDLAGAGGSCAREPARGRYQTAMRPASGRPPAVGGARLGGVGSGVPPQLTTPAAVTHSEAGLARAGERAGSRTSAALTRFVPTATGPSSLSIVCACGPPSVQRQLQRRAHSGCARSAAGARGGARRDVAGPARTSARRRGVSAIVGDRPRRCRCPCSSRAGAGSRRRSAARAARRRRAPRATRARRRRTRPPESGATAAR